jgi:hypothetical protein
VSAPEYSITAIGVKGQLGAPLHINDRGQVLGVWCPDPGQSHCSYYYETGGKYYQARPPSFGGAVQSACGPFLLGLNDNGIVAGWEALAAKCPVGSPLDFPAEAVYGRIMANGSLRLIPLHGLSGDPFPPNAASGTCWAEAIDADGTIAGTCLIPTPSPCPDNPFTAVVWKPSRYGYGNATPLAIPAGFCGANVTNHRVYYGARAMDTNGDVLGFGRRPGGKSAQIQTRDGLFWYKGTTPYVLPGLNLNGKPWHDAPDSYTSTPFGMASQITMTNGVASGHVVIEGLCRVSGNVASGNERDVPCMWNVTIKRGKVTVSQAIALGKRGCVEGVFGGINSHAWIVGASGKNNTDTALWIPHGGEYTLYPLQSLIPHSSRWRLLGPCAVGGPNDINDHGQIIGYALYRGQPEGYLMTPLRPGMSRANEPADWKSMQHGLTQHPATVVSRLSAPILHGVESDTVPWARPCAQR